MGVGNDSQTAGVPMATASQLVRYFRDCYEADNRETGIANLFAPKYRHVHFLSGTDDLLCGLFDRVPIDREKGLAARKEAELYRKDRTFDPEEAPAETLLRRYLSAITDGSASRGAPRELPPDRFLQAVEAELRREGFETWPAYPVAGMRVDLMVARDGKTLGIDLVGHPGEFASLFDLERYRMLQRAGLTLFPLPFRVWSEDRETCLTAIREWL
ncbi:MAG TPA: hypothetical protein DD670_07710 [Planctomycetaceae bacterium]|nr:hypothetical protein [Planctomycetaceae bacterium]